MTQYQLIPHPDFLTVDVQRVAAIPTRQANNEIGFRFMVTGDIKSLCLPKAEHPSDQFRRDELWRSTCFEAFVRPAKGSTYFETNLSPAGHWAAYQFEGYRHGMRDAEASHPWFTSDDRRADWYSISGNFLFDGLPAAPVNWWINLTAVIEAKDGTKSYWALAHAPGPPDFHNPDCFIATLPAPDAA